MIKPATTWIINEKQLTDWIGGIVLQTTGISERRADQLASDLMAVIEAFYDKGMVEVDDWEEDDKRPVLDEEYQPDCYFGTPDCEGPLWTCQTCGEKFCQYHFHETTAGYNVECAGCEYNRKEQEEFDD